MPDLSEAIREGENEMREYTRELVHHLHGMNFSDFSEKTVETARICVEDFIGVALAGAEKKEAEAAEEAPAEEPKPTAEDLLGEILVELKKK